MTIQQKGFPGGRRYSQFEQYTFAVVILLGVLARTSLLSKSLWLDEAWVANSVLEPSWRQMFYYERWAQTTPPLVLLCMRGMVHLFGSGEIALRVFPFLAGAGAVVLFGLAVRKMFLPPISLLATAFFATNYWAIKYSQQVKQYGSDLLVAAAFLFVTQEMLRTERSRYFWLLLLTASAGSFLSLPSLFWLPAAVLAIARSDVRGAGLTSIIRGCLRARCITLAGLFGICLAACYFVFFRPNITPGFSRMWRSYALGSGGSAFQGASRNFAGLLVPPFHQLAYPLGLLLLAVVCLGAFEAGRRARTGNACSRSLLLTAVLPIATAVALSLAKQVPMGDQQRVIIGLLPELVVLLFYPIDLGLGWCWVRRPSAIPMATFRTAVPLVCVATSLLGWGLFRAYSARYYRTGDGVRGYANEDNRGAVAFLIHNMSAEDCLFISGGVSEQFDYYTRLLRWKPPCAHLSNTGWQCCAKNWRSRVSKPDARSLEQEIDALVQRAGNGAVWMIDRGGRLRRLPTVMAEHGYILAERSRFGHVAIYAFRCTRCTVPQ
jgi:hypothetical protein